MRLLLAARSRVAIPSRPSIRVCTDRLAYPGIPYKAARGRWRGNVDPTPALARSPRGLNLAGPSQCHHQVVQAPGETVDIEIQRIVVAIGDLRVDRGMECGNKPSLSAYAGDDVSEREPIVLSGGEGGIGRSRVVAATVSGHAPPRLDEFVVQEQPLQRTTEFRCLLEFRFAPRN